MIGHASYIQAITHKVNNANLKPTVISPTSNELLYDIKSHFQSLYSGNHIKDYQKQINEYSHNPVFMENIVLNSKPYLYYIYQETRKYHVPAQLVYVPAAETNYAGGTSCVGAAGLWQFMPETAKGYGMRMRPGYDGRADVIKATDAGIKQLSASHKRFGSWLLAFAAYNCGDGRVARDIRLNRAKGLPTDFWHLPLPRQTKTYVRNILAISAIMTKPSAFGIKLPEIPDRPYFSKITIKHTVTPSSVGYISGISLKQMKKLNPAIKDWQVTFNKDYNILIPKDEKPQIVARLASINAIAIA